MLSDIAAEFSIFFFARGLQFPFHLIRLPSVKFPVVFKISGPFFGPVTERDRVRALSYLSDARSHPVAVVFLLNE